MKKIAFILTGLWLAVCSVMLTLSVAQAQSRTEAVVEPAKMVGINHPRLILKDDYIIIEDDEDIQSYAARCSAETGIPAEILCAVIQSKDVFGLMEENTLVSAADAK